MSVWKFIHDKYHQGVDVILMYVLSSTGSSPGRQGFKMVVAADGAFNGSIGGGIMEHKFVEMSRAILANAYEPENETYRQIHSKKTGANQSGMICSGEQTIFLHKVQAEDVAAIKLLIEFEDSNKNATLILTQDGIAFEPEVGGKKHSYEAQANGFILREQVGPSNILHIIGGGHCALALSRLMRELDFYIHVYDDRVALDTIERNLFAHEIHSLKAYTELAERVAEGENVYVVIMTFGYRTDDLAIRALLDKNFRYIGVMGSRAKIKEMITLYRSENIAEEKLLKLKAPIGLQIKSQTPAEIAVSIAAEIIKTKNADYQ